MKIERTKNTITGSFWGILNRAVCILFPFITRTIIINFLGVNYLGLNSLFASILNVLSLSELGLSGAIVYSMYKPIADDDHEAVNAILALYKKLYIIIGTIILVLGLSCVPFLKYLIGSDYPEDINIYFLFVLFLINTSINYFAFAYRESILYAVQRVDIINKIRIVSFTIMYALQIVVLVVFKNYYLFVACMILSTVLRSCLIYFCSKKEFPYFFPKGKVPSETKEEIKKTTIGAAIGKICSATRGTCDTIIISAFLGLTVLAIFDNYYYILTAIISVLYVFEQALTAGVGNSIAVDSIEKNYSDFKTISFGFMSLVGVCTVCLISLYQPFMKIWVGSGLLFPLETMFLFCTYFYCYGLSSIPSVYSNAKGLWWKMKIKSLCEIVLNLSLNFALVFLAGVNGILVATIITLVFVSYLWTCVVLFKSCFMKSVIPLLLNQLAHFIITAIVAATSFFLCSIIHTGNNYLDLFIDLVVALGLACCVYYICFFKTHEFKRITRQLFDFCKKKKER